MPMRHSAARSWSAMSRDARAFSIERGHQSSAASIAPISDGGAQW